MAPLPGLDKGVTKDPTPPATDTVVSPITIPNGTILVTTKTTNETIDNVNQLIDYVSGDAGPNFIPQSAISNLVSDLAAKEILSNKVVTVGTPGNDTNYPTEKAVRDALDLKEDSLGFTPEDSANKGAVSGYAALDSSQLLLLANFPTGTALQVLRRNAGNTALEFAAAGAEVFTWTAPHNADGNNFLLSGGLIQFDNVNTKITQVGTSIDFDIASGGSFIYKIVTATRFSVSNTKVNIHGSILDLNGGHIQFGESSTTIIQVTGGLEYNVADTKSHVFQILNTDEFSISQADINVHNKRIVNVLDPTGNSNAVNKGFADVNYLGIGSSLNDLSDVTITTPTDNDLLEFDTTGSQWKNRQGVFTAITGLGVQTQDLVMGAGNEIIMSDSTEIRWVNANRRIFNDTSGFIFEVEVNDVFKFRINTSDSLSIDSLNLTLLDGQNIVGPGFIDFAESGASKISGIATALGIKVDLEISDIFRIDVAGTPEYTFNDSQADFAGNSLVNAPHDHEAAAGGGQLTATLALDATGTKDATTFLRGDDTWAIPPATSGIDSINGDSTSAQLIIGTANLIVITQPVAGTTQIDIGVNVATSSDNLSFFASTTSAQLAGVISDETGSGLLVFGTSPIIVTPTIASFVNAGHNHETAAGGGQLNALNALNATGTKDSTTFLRGDNTWAVPAGGGGDVTGPALAADNEIVLYSGTSGKVIKRQNSPQATIINGTFLTRAVTVTEDGASPGNVNYMRHDGANLRFNARIGGISLHFGDTQQYLITASTFDFKNSNLLMTQGFLDIFEIATPANPPANYGRIYTKDVSTVTHLFFLDSAGTETDLLAGGGEVLTWTNDHSAARFNLENTGAIEFSLNGPISSPAITSPYILYDGNLAPDAIVMNIPSADEFRIHFNGVEEYSFAANQTDFHNNTIFNLATISINRTSNIGSLTVGRTNEVAAQDAGQIKFRGGNTDYAQIHSQMVVATSGSERGNLEFLVKVGNTTTPDSVMTFLGGTSATGTRIMFGAIVGSGIDLGGTSLNNVSVLFSNAANPADNGFIRMGDGEEIRWENTPVAPSQDSAIRISNEIFEILLNASGVPATGVDYSFSETAFDMNANMILDCGSITLNNGSNLILNTTTGTIIGTDAAQKLGFWNTTPIIQPAHITDPTGGATIDAEARTAINSILAQLADTGLQASV